MQALFHSPFFQALGFAIVNSIWQMSFVWLSFVLLNILFKPKAVVKYSIAVTAQLIGFIWFIFTLQFYYFKCAEALNADATLLNPSTALLIVDNGNTFQSFLLHLLIKTEQFLPILSIAYILLLLILIVKWVFNYHSTQSICSKGLSKIDLQWKMFIQQTAAQLDIKRKIRIHISSLINSPLTIGFIKPMILIPLSSINYLSTEQMEAVLLHELAHIKRQDYLLNLILSITEIILFFNPFTQLFSRTIQRERENACDDWVIQFQYNPAVYAEALLQIASLSNISSPSLSMAATNKNGDMLLARVKRMIYNKEQNFNYRNQILSLLLITAVVGCIARLQPASLNSNKNFVAEKTLPVAKKIIIEPLTAKIDNPLFNPIFFLKKPLQKEVEKNLTQAINDGILAKQLIKTASDALVNAAPMIEKELAAVDMNKIQHQLAEQFKDFPVQQIKLDKIKNDSLLRKKILNDLMDNKFLLQLSKIGAEMSKVKNDIDQEIKHKEFADIDEAKWEEDINKAINTLEMAGVPALSKLKKMEDELKQKNNKIKLLQLETQKQLMKQKITKIASTIHISKRKIDSLNLLNQPSDLFYTYNDHLPETQVQPALYEIIEDENNAPKAVLNNSLQKNMAGAHVDKEDSTVTKQIEIILTDKKGKQKKIVIQLEKE
jgi:beta-lactamase regulating signal transducer with metallopeptidase domain